MTETATGIARGRRRNVGNTRTATDTVCVTEGNSSGRRVGRCVRKRFGCGLSEALSRVEPRCRVSRAYREAMPRTVVTFLRSGSFRSTIHGTMSLNKSASALKTVAKDVTRTFCKVPTILVTRYGDQVSGKLVASILSRFSRILNEDVSACSSRVSRVRTGRVVRMTVSRCCVRRSGGKVLLFVRIVMAEVRRTKRIIIPCVARGPFVSRRRVDGMGTNSAVSLSRSMELGVRAMGSTSRGR